MTSPAPAHEDPGEGRRRSRLRRVVEKLVAGALGLLTVLVMLEIGLRIAGERFWRPEGRYGHEASEQLGQARSDCVGCQVVLAIGDSFTYGIGATRGNDYPSQLQRLLDDERGAGETVVYNGGLGGANSSMILATLPSHLESVRPDVVVVMAGNTNIALPWGIAAHREGGTAGGVAHDLLFRLRTYRLVHYLTEDVRTARRDRALARSAEHGLIRPIDCYVRYRERAALDPGGMPPLPADFGELAELIGLNQLETARSRLIAAVEANPEESAYYFGLGQVYRGLHDIQAARSWYERGRQVDRRDASMFFGLGELKLDRGQFDARTRAWFEQGIEVDPRFALNYVGVASTCQPGRSDEIKPMLDRCLEEEPDAVFCYQMLVMHHQQHGTSDQFAEQLAVLAERSVVAEDFLEVLRLGIAEAELQDWIHADVGRMVTLARESGAAVLLQEYPMPCPTNHILGAVAAEFDAPLVSNEATFQERIGTRDIRTSSYFVPDGHPSDQGYDLMARGVLAALGDEALLGPP